MRLGFTGTRHGMTPSQLVSVGILFKVYAPELELHHGDCVGADEHAHDLAGRVNARRVVHPPTDQQHRAFVQYYDEIRDPQTKFARNRAIVNETSALVATPWQDFRPSAKTGGGTWYTIEYAEKKGRHIYIVWPDGRIADSNGILSRYSPVRPNFTEASLPPYDPSPTAPGQATEK